MKHRSRPVCLLVLSLLATEVFFTSLPCVCQLQWSRQIQVDIFSDGSATWVVGQRTVLTSEDDEAAFFQYLNVTSLDDISNSIHSMVNHASLVAGRSMLVKNDSLVVNGEVSSKGLSKEGIIQYQFDWLGFAEKIGDEKINIGDALSGELDLSLGDVLTIKYPIGYVPGFSYPSADETEEAEKTLTWFGPRNFGAGEPHVLLEKKNSSWTDLITGNITLLAVLVAAVSSGFLGYFLGIKRVFVDKGLKPKVAEERATFSGSDVEDDEEKIIRLLVAADGQVNQSTITRQLGFSKSKTSELLSVMERRGIVTRKKMGRGKIVTLIQKQRKPRKDEMNRHS